MMDIRSRAESLRPFRYFRSHRQHEHELEFAAAEDEGIDDPESQGARQLGPNAFFEHSADGLPIAVVGLACRFPDADDPAALLDLVLTERRPFRRLPPGRLNLADYYSADRATPDATYSARAAVIEGWQFDLAAFGVPAAVFLTADPAHWLALETAARALAAAGFPLGQGLARSRTGVIIGNTLNGDASRAAALRLRWPYVRRVFAEALAAGDIPRERAMPVLRHAAARYLAPFPVTTDETLTGATPASIAARICGYFGFRGGGYAVDGSQASSLVAVASACAALAAGDLDVALAGGVDLSLDPLELVGLAKAGVLARGDMRVYDENPTGYLPGEGCGIVVLMRSADARKAGLPVYAEIAGWGTASAGKVSIAVPDAHSQLLALHRAYQRARIAPTDVQLIEGHGAGTAAADITELSALAELHVGARHGAALGSITANIGNTKAAAGAAGLIKTVLAMSTGIIPPATGFSRPHPLLRGGDAGLRLPRAPETWPDGTRIAGVSAMGPGLDVHLVLRSEPARGRHERRAPGAPPAGRAETGPAAGTGARREIGSLARSTAYLLHAPDRTALAAILARIAHVAPWLSDAELGDLACQLARDAADQGQMRMALVASKQDQLARLASQATALLSGLGDGLLAQRPGIFAADSADGRVTVLLSDTGVLPPGDAGDAGDGRPPGDQALPLAALRWLDQLGVSANAAVGYGQGEIAGLIWAGCLPEEEAVSVMATRTKILYATSSPTSPAGSDDAAPDPVPANRGDLLRVIVRRLRLAAPQRRLISATLGHEVSSADDVADLLCAKLDCPTGLGPALQAGALGASLLVETGPGQILSEAAAVMSEVPAISLGAGIGVDAARAAAALFAVGALEHPARLYEGRPSRPIDIWREQTFITSPCQAPAPALSHAVPAARRPEAGSPSAADALAADAEAADATTAAGPEQPAGPKRGAGRKGTAGSRAATGSVLHEDTEPSDAVPSTPLAQAAAMAQRIAAAGLAAAARQRAAGLAPDAPDEEATGGDSVPAAEDQATALDTATHRPAPAAGRPATTTDGPALAAEAARGRAAGITATAPAALPGAAAGAAVAGVGPWARCFAEELRPVAEPVPSADDGPWRVRAATGEAFGPLVNELFTDDPAAERALAIVSDPASPDACAVALAAARDAIASGRLVVVTNSPGFTGFCASLYAEHPELGITVLRVPESADGLRAARRFATAEPGRFRELVIDTASRAHETVMVPAETPGAGEFPLGPTDVVLISRSSGGAVLALAQVLACCGAPIALIGRAAPGETPEVEAGLERLAAAGVRIAVEPVDVANAADLHGALGRIEASFGRVTAVAHSVGTGGPQPFAEITDDELRAHVAAETAGLDYLISAIPARQLRLIVTFGSVVGRYGLAGESLLALASGALAERSACLSDTIPGCRTLHVDWPAWAGSGLGQRGSLADGLACAGTSAISLQGGARLLLKTLATPGLPVRVAIHGRVGGPARLPAASLPDGRFLEQARVHYPGIELVCDARLTLRTDPYLSDYQVDGIPVLPPTMALEAMAEAAAALAGQPLRQLTGVSMVAPVVLPAGADAHELIRICALRDGASVTVALRCEESSFATDHFLATFRVAQEAADAVAPSLAADLPELDEMPASDAGIVDGTELYGPTFFQSGRFRRVALLPEVTARSCRALVRGDDGQGWFGDPGDPDTDSSRDAGLILGSPGLNDTSWHVLQACVPHRRLLPAGCESVTFSGREAAGAVEIQAVEVSGSTAAGAGGAVEGRAVEVSGSTAAGAGTAGTEEAGQEAAPPARQAVPDTAPTAKRSLRRSVPRPRSGAKAAQQPPVPAVVVPAQGSRTGETSVPSQAAEYVWDVEAVDTAGQPLVTWRGLRIADAGPLPRRAPWPPSLLSVYLERSAVALGLNPELRVTVQCGQPGGGTAPDTTGPQAKAAVVPAPSPAPDSQPPAGRHESPANTARGRGLLDGFVLTVEAPEAAVCSWAAAAPVPSGAPDLGPALAGFEQQLRIRPDEPPAVINARLKAVAACLARAGAPEDSPIAADDDTGADWLRLRVGGATLACTVVEVSGVSSPVAIAIMTGKPGPGSPRGRDSGRRARPQATTRS
jgi:enediyne polyketide synthase